PKKISDALQDPSWVEAMQEELLQFKIQKKEDGIFLSQDKYVGDILKKFGYSDVRSSNTPMDKENPWGKDGTGKDVDLYLYRSMIGSLMYLTASRPDIMFAVSEAEYVAAASCCGQVQWIQNQLLDYGEILVLSCKYWDGTSKYWGILRILMIGLRLIPLGEHNTDFHPMVDFIEASPLRVKAQEHQLSPITHPPKRQYTRRDRIAQSSALPPVADEPASPVRDDSQGEACPTNSGFIADHDRATIAKSSTLPHDSAPKVTSHTAEEGSMQQSINELTALYTSLQRQHLELLVQFQAQKVEINRLKERVTQLEEREGVAAINSGDDTPIKGRSMDDREAAIERVSDDTEKMATVLTSMDAATVLASRVVDVPTSSGSIPTASTLAEGSVPTGSEEVPTASPVFATATVVTPVTRRKGKEVMVESKTPKKKKVQEQIDTQVARELEEQLEKEDQRRAEQIANNAEIARIHAEEELQSMIDGLDSNNETVAKYLEEYRQFSSELPLERRIELISDLTKKQKRDYYMAVIRNNLGWKVKDFRGMTFEEVEAKFNSVCKQIEDFIPMVSKEEAEKIKRKGINLEQESAKKQKSSEEITEEAKSPEEVPEEKVKEMMNLVPIEEVYVEALQVKHPIIDWKVHSEGQRNYWKITSTRPPTSNKEMELWVELSRLYEPDEEDQLWTHIQNFMHAPVDWKLYNSCGVHHVAAKDKEIFMLVEKDYPLRKGLALVIICYKLQVENFSQMANELVLKIYRIANSPRQQGMLLENLLEDSTKVKTVHEDVQIRALIDGKNIIITEASIRRDLQLQDAEGTACLPNDTVFEEFARMREGKGISRIITPLFETIMVQAPEEVGKGSKVPTDTYHISIVTKPSSSQPQKKQTSRRNRGSKLRFLTLSHKLRKVYLQLLMIHYLVKAKTAQAKEIADLKKRVKKVECSKDKESLGDQKDASKQRRRIDNIDQDEEIALVDETQERMNEEEMFGVNDLDDPVITVGKVVNTTEDVEVTTTITTPQISKDELTLAQTLIEIKAAKPKVRWVIVQEPSEFRTTSSSQPSQLPYAKDKGKRIMVEPKKPLKKKYQIAFNEEVARNLEAQMKAEMEEEERIAKEKDKANIVMQKKQACLWKLLEKRRKFLARKREIEKRNRPPTKAQQRNLMCTYLKNMDGWKPKSLKKKSFDEIQKLFDSVMKMINTFVDKNTKIVEERSKKTQAEVTEGSSKRARDELEQESAKRQKLEKEDDSIELKRCLEILPENDDDVTKATPLSSKSPTIVDYKIYKEGKKSYFKIIRANGNSQSYLTFGKMFKNFNREDLEVLWSIVKERFIKTMPIDDMNNLLFQTLKTMFEHHTEDNIYRYQQGIVKFLHWKLFDSCGVHCSTTQNMVYYLLVEKMYLFTRNILHQMLNDVRL
nr:hypothetical protein [Tanacetum cinerariifolium]